MGLGEGGQLEDHRRSPLGEVTLAPMNATPSDDWWPEWLQDFATENPLATCFGVVPMNNFGFKSRGASIGHKKALLRPHDKLVCGAPSHDQRLAFGNHASGGVVSVSHDAGETFQDVVFDPQVLYDAAAVEIVNQTTAFMSGWSPDKPCGLFRNRDGGATWDDVSPSAGAHCFSEMLFFSTTEGYAVASLASDTSGGWGGESVGIASTTDGGETWAFERLEPQPNGSALRLIADEGALYAVNESGLWTARRAADQIEVGP